MRPSKTAQQTLWGTAISPVAVVDMAIVAWRTIVMVRDIANLYGYRPGFLGSLRLFSRILSTVAFAGFSDLVVDAGSNLLGHTLLSRLSVTFANALAVGMLTVRVGIAACINCRPLPFQKGELNNQANLLFKGIKDMLSIIFRKKIKQKSGYMDGWMRPTKSGATAGVSVNVRVEAVYRTDADSVISLGCYHLKRGKRKRDFPLNPFFLTSYDLKVLVYLRIKILFSTMITDPYRNMFDINRLSFIPESD